MQVGRLFQEVSGGQFTERIAPWLMQAAPFAGVDRLPFQQALQSAVRDKRKVCSASSRTSLVRMSAVPHACNVLTSPHLQVRMCFLLKHDVSESQNSHPQGAM